MHVCWDFENLYRVCGDGGKLPSMGTAGTLTFMYASKAKFVREVPNLRPCSLVFRSPEERLRVVWTLLTVLYLSAYVRTFHDYTKVNWMSCVKLWLIFHFIDCEFLVLFCNYGKRLFGGEQDALVMEFIFFQWCACHFGLDVQLNTPQVIYQMEKMIPRLLGHCRVAETIVFSFPSRRHSFVVIVAAAKNSRNLSPSLSPSFSMVAVARSEQWVLIISYY